MSISYEQQDTMLYEILWSVNQNKIKCSSTLYNKTQFPWKINWFEHHNIEQFLITLNDQTLAGKTCLKFDTMEVVYEVCAQITSQNLSLQSLKDIVQALYRSITRYVNDISNAMFLYFSNPNLRPKEILNKYKSQNSLCGQYNKVDIVTIDQNEKYLNVSKFVEIEPITEIDSKKLNINKSIEIEGYSEVYLGEYLTLPCLFFLIENFREDELFKSQHLQYESIP